LHYRASHAIIEKMLNEYNSGNLYIRHAIDESPRPTSFNMHIHERCEIYFFVSGSVEYLVEGSRYPLDENSLLIMRPAESHTARILDIRRYERYAVNFPVSYLSEFDIHNRLMKPFLDRPLGKDNLFTAPGLDTRLVKNLFEQMTTPREDYEKRISLGAQLPMLVYMIYRAYSERTSTLHKPTTLAERTIAYINNHLFEEICVSSIARHFNLSTSQFSRMFKQSIGSSPWEYILQKRLAAARELLLKGVSTQETCTASGFGDYSAFYRAYTKYLHESPRETRERR
jgi:AraC-like DNA-binding protein